MRGVAFIFILLLCVSPAAALYREGSDAEGTYKVEDEKQYPIIFIPGVAGSELWVGEQNAWPGWLGQRVTGGNFDKIISDKNGKDEYSVLARQSIRSGLEANLGGYGTWQLLPDAVVGVYGPFFEYMEAEGYSAEPNPENGLRLLDFPYDWRKDNHINVEYLDVAIDDLRKETHSDKVILFAHSMGGVIARLYVADPKRAEKVAGIIFMGTPHQGSPKPYYAYVHGYNFGNLKLSNERMWEIMGNWEAGYQLFSFGNFVVDAQTGEEWTDEQLFGTDWVGEQEYEHYIADPDNWNLRYGLPNRKYAQRVREFQSELGTSLPQYPWIEYYMIEGFDQETTQFLMAHLESKPGVDKPVLRLEEVKSQEGDGTVPTRGAQVEGLTRIARPVHTDHGSIPGFSGTHPHLTEFRKVINDEERRFDYAARIVEYADREFERVRTWQSEGSVWAWVKNAIGSWIRPNVEKISAREELRGSVREMLTFSRINILVGEGEQQDSFFLVINDLEIVDGWPGNVKPSTARVEIDSWETLDGLLDGSIKIETAYKDGRVKLKGVGVVKSFQLKLAKWFGKYRD